MTKRAGVCLRFALFFVLALLATDVAGAQTPSFLQANAAGNFTVGAGNASVATTLGSSTPVGNVIIVDVDYDDTTNRSANLPTDDAGNTYHLYVGPRTCFGPSPFNFDAQTIYWAANSAPGTRTVTSTTTTSSGSQYHFIYVEELQNASTTSPFAGSSFSCSSPNPLTNPSLAITLTKAPALVIGFDSTGSSVPSTSPGGWSQRYSAQIGGGPNGLPFAAQDAVESSVGAVSVPWTNASSQNHLMWDLVAVSVASTNVYYIDYASGSNSQDGTEKTHTTGVTGPWKTHPYMTNSTACDGGVGPSYPTHQIGDQFIFEGGDSWPSACFQMTVSTGGSAATPDYYGVCLSTDPDSPCFGGTSWPSTGWTRPKFAADSLKLNGAFQQQVIRASTSCVGFGSDFSVPGPACNHNHFDNIEIGPWDDVPGSNVGGNIGLGPAIVFGGDFSPYAATDVVLENMYIHDWFASTNITGTSGCNPSTVCSAAFGYGIIYGVSLVTNTTISDAAGYFTFNGVRESPPILGGVAGATEVKNSVIHDAVAGCSSVAFCHDNEFYNVFGAVILGIHTHVIYDDALAFQTTFAVYNNAVHDTNAGLITDLFYHTAIYNNVFWNNTNNAGIAIYQCAHGAGSYAPCGDNSSQVGYVFNNTIDMTGGSGPCYHWDDNSGTAGLGTLYFQNNICIPAAGGIGGFNVTTPHTSNNFNSMTPTEQTAFGFTATNKYKPSGSDPNVVGQGANLTSFATGNLAALAKDASGTLWIAATAIARAIPGTSPWNTGALELASGPLDSLSPSSLTFATQTTGTSSSPQVSTLTNAGSATDAISAISITGANSSQFTQTNDCPSALSAGASCHISTTFSPTVAGSLSANVSITDTVNPSGAAIISLTGTGQAPGLWTLTQVAPYVESPGSATCVLTFPANPATGSTVAIGAVPGPNSGDTLTAVDSNSNSYTLSAHSPSPILSGSGQAYVFYIASAPSNASKTITITDSTASPSYFDCGGANFQVVSGFTPSFDVDASAVSGSALTLNVPTLTPSTAQEALFLEATPGNFFSAIGAPWTSNVIYVPNSGAPHWATSDGYVVNQTSAINPNLSSQSPGGGSAVIAAFKATATGSTPTISSLSILSGNEGASVTITGTNFGASQGTSTVQINATLVTCGTWSATSLICTIPTPATTGGISVTTTAGTSNSLTFTVTPHLASLSVTTGIVGTSVTATGTGLGATQGASTFTFNGTACSPSSWSDSSAICTVPAAATTGNVNITQGGNASNSISFTVTPHISLLNPTSGVVGAGVTITGTTFGATQGSSTVKFNGTAATCTGWSPTSLSCSVPSTTTGSVVVNVLGNNSNGISFTVNAPVSTPVIASVTPNVGLAGTTVTITGSNFGSSQSTSTVSFNGVIAAVSTWSATSIVCTSPVTASTGNILVTVSGSASNPVPYGVYQFPTITIR
jgi:hypothetical protein